MEPVNTSNLSATPPAKPKIKLNKKGKEESEADGLLPPAPGSGPSRRSARQANKKWESDYSDIKPIKQEDVEATPTTKKRSLPDRTPGSAKRVKFESGEDGEVKVEVKQEDIGLLSPEETPSEDSDAKPSIEEDDEDFSEDEKPKKARKNKAEIGRAHV